ncbi:hypothetical protein QBC39DRAFT_72550 [Podospora conica]|nr:hypothetical protein QBC39DRAFT_72550 [Schizothecium conicum]
MGERTGSRAFQWVWSYVFVLLDAVLFIGAPSSLLRGTYYLRITFPTSTSIQETSTHTSTSSPRHDEKFSHIPRSLISIVANALHLYSVVRHAKTVGSSPALGKH